MGAMTYIGNGPNFMVKAIAEQAGVQMPSFFGFIFRYSIPVLVPVFILITVIFLPQSRPTVYHVPMQLNINGDNQEMT